MKDEIREILDRIETASEIFDCLLKPEECTELLDYITNLQQENEIIEKEYKSKVDDIRKLTSKIYKAIEFINKYCIDGEFYINLSYKEKAIIEVLNILQNGSEDNG